MYCPQCATPHTDGAKFCRSCGTEMEAVALVLSGKPAKPAKAVGKKNKSKTAEDWLEKHGEGVSGVTTGMSLLIVSALIGVAMAFFVPADVPWILVWMVFFGWMACWGGFALGDGLGNLLVSRSRLRQLALEGKEPSIDSTPQQLSTTGEPATIANPSPAAFKQSPPLSVTEGTTRQLDIEK